VGVGQGGRGRGVPPLVRDRREGGVCNGPRKSGLPDLRIFDCRSRVDPRSVSAAHHAPPARAAPGTRPLLSASPPAAMSRPHKKRPRSNSSTAIWSCTGLKPASGFRAPATVRARRALETECGDGRHRGGSRVAPLSLPSLPTPQAMVARGAVLARRRGAGWSQSVLLRRHASRQGRRRYGVAPYLSAMDVQMMRARACAARPRREINSACRSCSR
jgi:hypothetical protein